METLRLSLTVIWCAVLAGLNIYTLIVSWGAVFGGHLDRLEPLDYLPLAAAGLMCCLAVATMIRPGLIRMLFIATALWTGTHAILSITAERLSYITPLGALVLVVPTYLLARWHTSADRARRRATYLTEEF